MKKAGAKRKTAKPKKPKLSQSQKFIETAKALDVDESGEPFERAMGAVARSSKKKTEHAIQSVR